MQSHLSAVLLGIALMSSATAQVKTDKQIERSPRGIAAQAVSRIASESATEDVVKLQLNSMLREFKRSGISEQAIAEISLEVDQIAKRVSQSWDPHEASRIYSEQLAKRLTADELQNAERYFQSEEGQKVFQAISASQSLMQVYIGIKTSEAMKIEVNRLIPKAMNADMKSKDEPSKTQ